MSEMSSGTQTVIETLGEVIAAYRQQLAHLEAANASMGRVCEKLLELASDDPQLQDLLRTAGLDPDRR